jgi:ribosome-binding protein aMBF1 (putative translation factor)
MSNPHQDWTQVVWNKNKPTIEKKKVPKQFLNKVNNSINVEKIYDPENPDAEPEIRPVMIEQTFAQQITQARLTKGLTQKQVANALSIPVAVINEYERGTGVRDGNYVSKLKKYFNLTKNN